jgi:hypothetical protein
MDTSPRRNWTTRSGFAAAVGAVGWTVMPWLETAAYGTRPYVATEFDAVGFVGWLLMGVGLVGVRARFGDRFARLGRVGVGLVGVGTILVGAVRARSVAIFVDAGFRAVPATGEDPAGLILTWAVLLGYGFALAGAGALGLAFRRLDRRRRLTAGLLVAAPLVPALAVGLRLLGLVPLPVGRLLVGTNVALVPFGVGWAALGWQVFVARES